MRGRAFGLALVCALAAGCGTTTITTNRRDARIYVDGAMVGRGEAEIRQRGMSSSARIEVRTEDGARGERTIKRRFTGTTLVIGLFTYGVGLFTALEYPDEVYVQIEEAPQGDGGWGGSAWDQPPSGWSGP
jgi:hypothetical protein